MGNCQGPTATMIATIKPSKAACHAGRRSRPNRITMVRTGNAATTKDKARLLATGVSN